jgi:hypothetical protein
VTEDQDAAARAQLEETVARLAEKIRQGKAEYLRGQKFLRFAAEAERRRLRKGRPPNPAYPADRAELEAGLDATAARIAEAEAGLAGLTAILEQPAVPAQPRPLTVAEAGQLLRDIGAGEQALASYEADPEGMTEGINAVRCSPLDLAVKQALIDGESVESVAARFGLAVPGEGEQPHDGNQDT